MTATTTRGLPVHGADLERWLADVAVVQARGDSRGDFGADPHETPDLSMSGWTSDRRCDDAENASERQWEASCH